jgi:mannose-6-phosphate isomerase
VDAGTVHAIGPGVVLLETQQTSDITYRLYDYGRPRELHIDRGLAATRLQTAAGKVAPKTEGPRTCLIRQKYFTVDRLDVNGRPFQSEPPAGIPQSLVAVEGKAVLHAEGFPPVELIPGRAVVVPAAVEGYRLESNAPATVIRSQPSVGS